MVENYPRLVRRVSEIFNVCGASRLHCSLGNDLISLVVKQKSKSML